jgi:large subunit ribosomal protein L24e
MHKKGVTEEVAKKRSRKTVKHQVSRWSPGRPELDEQVQAKTTDPDWTFSTVYVQRGIVGADLASILAKRNAKPEVRNAARQAAITKAKEAKKEKETNKKANKVGFPRSIERSVRY